MKLRKVLKAIDEMDPRDRWAVRQHLAGDGRYYGDVGTIHYSSEVDVETADGRVVSVWFRCQLLPFEQHDVDTQRATSMRRAYSSGEVPGINGIELEPERG